MSETKKLSAYALLVALLGGGGGFAGFNAAIDVADARWVTYEELAGAELKGYIRDLKREIRRLNYLVGEGTATDYDKWELDRLKEDLEEAENEQT